MSAKEVYNSIRIKNIKRAKLRQKEAELDLYAKKQDMKKVTQVMNEISNLKKELNKK